MLLLRPSPIRRTSSPRTRNAGSPTTSSGSARARIQLFAAYVDTTGGSTVTDFAASTAEMKSLGGNDALLLVAVDDRPDALWVGPSLDGVTDAEIDAIFVDAVEPNLQSGDFVAAIVEGASARGRGQAAAVTPLATSSPASRTTTCRRERGGRRRLPNQPHPGARGPVARRRHPPHRLGGLESARQGQRPAAHADQLNRDANRALLATDEALKDATNDVEFAAAQWGDAEVAAIATPSPRPPRSSRPPSRFDICLTTPSQTRRPNETGCCRRSSSAPRPPGSSWTSRSSGSTSSRPRTDGAPTAPGDRPGHRRPSRQAGGGHDARCPAGIGLAASARARVRQPTEADKAIASADAEAARGRDIAGTKPHEARRAAPCARRRGPGHAAVDWLRAPRAAARRKPRLACLPSSRPQLPTSPLQATRSPERARCHLPPRPRRRPRRREAQRQPRSPIRLPSLRPWPSAPPGQGLSRLHAGSLGARPLDPLARTRTGDGRQPGCGCHPRGAARGGGPAPATRPARHERGDRARAGPCRARDRLHHDETARALGRTARTRAAEADARLTDARGLESPTLRARHGPPRRRRAWPTRPTIAPPASSARGTAAAAGRRTVLDPEYGRRRPRRGHPGRDHQRRPVRRRTRQRLGRVAVGRSNGGRLAGWRLRAATFGRGRRDRSAGAVRRRGRPAGRSRRTSRSRGGRRKRKVSDTRADWPYSTDPHLIRRDSDSHLE